MTAAPARLPEIAADPRLIVPLDLPTAAEARAMVEALGESVSFYKVGLELFATGDGMALARELKAAGKQVFLDWKLHDIGTTVQRSAAVLAESGCDLLTVHGEPQVMEAAVRGRGRSGLKILAVTVMTSPPTTTSRKWATAPASRRWCSVAFTRRCTQDATG